MKIGLLKRYRFLLFFLAGPFLSFCVISPAYAQATKTVGQLKFNVPEEWPVEKRGGLVTPIPTEEFVMMKFKEIEKEFLSVRDELKEKFNAFDSGLKKIEEELAKETKKAREQSATSTAAGTNLAQIVSDVETIKSELARLDRKITNKIMELQALIEGGSNPQVDKIKEDVDRLQTQIYKLDEKVDYLQESQESAY